MNRYKLNFGKSTHQAVAHILGAGKPPVVLALIAEPSRRLLPSWTAEQERTMRDQCVAIAGRISGAAIVRIFSPNGHDDIRLEKESFDSVPVETRIKDPVEQSMERSAGSPSPPADSPRYGRNPRKGSDVRS